MSEDLILTPDEVAKRRARKKVEEVKKPVNENKFYNKAGGIFIQYESKGRFDTKTELGFKDFTGADVNDIIFSRKEDLLENVITMLNKNMIQQEEMSDVGDMTMEEFLETIIAIKKQFNTHLHKHLWMCSCQSSRPQEDQQISETEINLNTINYQSIEEADAEFRKAYKEDIDNLSDSEWVSFVGTYYKGQKDASVWTKDDEVNKIQIKEPIRIHDDAGNVYDFKLTRMKDVIHAQKLANKKYSSRITAVHNRKEHGVALADLKEKKQKEVQQLEYERDKAIMLYGKAMSLVKMNGRELSDSEKIETYSNFPRSLLLDYMTFIDKIRFGVNDTVELSCPVCGKVSKESLRQEFDIIQLLPFDADSSGKRGKLSRLNFSFGD